MSSKKDKTINILLIVVYIITLAAIIVLVKTNVFTKDTSNEIVEPVIPNSGFEKVEIKDLETKMKKFSFVNKKQDYIKENTITTLNSNISSGKVTISVKIRDQKKEYVVPEIEDAKSIGSYLVLEGSGTHISYILTESGKVYKLVDSLSDIKGTENYVGTPKDLGLTNVVSIAIEHNMKNSLLEDKTKVQPFVYIKTDDNRYFTDEALLEGKEVVELVEQKEEVKENASES